MSPVYVVFAFLCYMLSAILIPLGWALIPVWRHARIAKSVTCPMDGRLAVVNLDAWYAVKMHALGDGERRVRDCSEWPTCGHCGQECVLQPGD